ncbi:MAG TPA: protein-glutamate O-methyltransferase [Rectinemataceae bacterium]|nr:protein-glutamate O-methyltransferase [Rectinemataceae bacterium]
MADADRAAGAFMPGTAVLSDSDFRKLAQYIESELGIRMPETKRVMLESRLQKRLRRFNLPSFKAYVEYVFSPEGRETELINMIDAVTTNKTDFFREPDHFDFLIERIVPDVERRFGAGLSRPFLAWSAGCSTGEEPYTLAMVLEEHRQSAPRFQYRIFASDLSTQVLEKAVEAVYDESKAEVVPMSYKKRYMLRSRDRGRSLVRMKPEIRAKVKFARINFMDERYDADGEFDVIFCRNVIIYFERKVQEAILRRLADHLREGSYLVLGHSETLTGMDIPLRGVAPTIYVRT